MMPISVTKRPKNLKMVASQSEKVEESKGEAKVQVQRVKNDDEDTDELEFG